ncbi:hypothetical protein [Kutzneria albida]|uniref:Uncharacterized protein n=1 Tax=Kutzneria albida DSM 43870 TaxID=1449976 RepID=W5WE40_9PSEU|nr:hypothetical protein [Kutzneria albida]AHH99453.1 hypothetical protein KALB_6093 [Kutzneria albida DSM 43870]
MWLAGDQPLVCTFARSSVLVSDPAAEPLPSAAAQVRLRAATPDGVLVGTLAKPELRSTVVPPDRLAKDELATRGPAFALVGEWSSPETPVELGGTPVKAPTGYGLLRVVDRPVAQGDRDSETGRALGACMARRAATGYPVADAEAWQPGPSLPVPAGTRFLLGYYGDSVGSCLRSADGTGDFLASSEESAPGRISVVYGSALAPDVRTTSAPTCEFLWGRLTGAARQVVFTGPNGETAQAHAGVDGLFVAAVPVRRTLPDNGIRFGVSVRDGEGKQIEYYQVLQ